jgi:hypothetical protein
MKSHSLTLCLTDASGKRDPSKRINDILRRNMISSPSENLTYSLAYVQIRECFEELPERFLEDAALLGTELPLFQIPKSPTPSEHKSPKKRGVRRKPPKKGLKKKVELPSPQSHEIESELLEKLRETIRIQFRQRLLSFEKVARESQAITKQLTHVNELERLDTNLEAEVDDDF